jgi:hypothetical protein
MHYTLNVYHNLSDVLLDQVSIEVFMHANNVLRNYLHGPQYKIGETFLWRLIKQTTALCSAYGLKFELANSSSSTFNKELLMTTKFIKHDPMPF